MENNLTNIILTNNIVNMEKKYIHNFLHFDYCNKEYNILQKKISDLNSTDTLSNIGSEQISKYYIKLTHLFATIFNITSNDFYIQDNKMIISTDISNCIPEIKYLYKTLFDYDNNKYVLNTTDIETYNKHLDYFNNFLTKHTYKSYKNINLKNISNRKINQNKLIFESNFNNYTYYLTILLQKNKNIRESIMTIINKHFIFQEDHIKNIISMKILDEIITTIRNMLIAHFFDIENAFKNVIHFFKLFLFEQFHNTIENRIKLL
mgnify:CR=1 FL=1|tara:strand:+ start:2278 stop:3066 length:789 start_codon:yes stop_codon:yes gene_type:complete